MPEPIDLHTVIEDAITDATIPEDTSTPVEDVGTETPVEAPVETQDAAAEAPEAAGLEVESPAQKAPEDPNSPNFAMDKKLGIPSHTNGRENRIPYSRVKKIVENAEKAIQTKLDELAPKVQDYEQRLQRVAEFEQVMVNQPERFMQMLQSLPAYRPFFDALSQMQAQIDEFQKVKAQPQTAQTPAVTDSDPMPEPDDKANGVYTLEGLKQLMAWQERQVEAKVSKRVAEQYDPIRKEWEAQQQLKSIIPQVEAQIKEARTWPMFTENEAEIVEVLAKYPNASLESAYRHVVFPKLQADRNAIRQQVLDELKKAPPATSAPARPQKSNPVSTNTGPRSLEDVISESINGLRGR